MPKAVNHHTGNPRLSRAVAACRAADDALSVLVLQHFTPPRELTAPLCDAKEAARDAAIRIPARTLSDLRAKAEIATLTEDLDDAVASTLADVIWLLDSGREVRP